MKYLENIRDLGLDALMKEFTEKMIEKTRKETIEGRNGWSELKEAGLKGRISENVGHEEWLNLSIYAAMMWNLEEK